MDLTTYYLGLKLEHPLITGASPLVDHMDLVRRLEDAGAAAITMHSLFEEQLSGRKAMGWRKSHLHPDAEAETTTYFPEPDEYALGPDAYLERLRRIKDTVAIPVIASLNGVTAEGWSDYASRMQQAGADALELNVYAVATDPAVSGADVDQRVVDITRTVRAAVTIPIAVKLSPFYSSLAHLAVRIDEAGANGLVLFNRFHQPDLDIEMVDVSPQLQLSAPSELLLRVRWLAILAGRLRGSLACSGGVHTAEAAIKAIMAGADAVQLVSVLLQKGPGHLAILRRELRHWMELREYDSVAQVRGALSLSRSPDPAAHERGHYLRQLQTWRRPDPYTQY